MKWHGISSIQEEEDEEEEKKKKNFHEPIGLTFNEETSEMLHLEHSFVWC